MQRAAFKMKLFEGFESEYKKRHDELWPELKKVLRDKGIKNYSIFLDEETHILFGYLTIETPARLEELSDEPVVKKWWEYMKDIMETNDDHSPVTLSLKEVFYLA